MAYRIIIEMSDEVDLPIAVKFFNKLGQVILNKLGFFGLNNAWLENEKYESLAEIRPGYKFKDIVSQLKAERNAEISRLQKLVSNVKESEDAVN